MGSTRHRRLAEEHINDWRHYATLAGALLRSTGEQASGGGGRDEDWVLICQSRWPKTWTAQT